jgi:hypothetical protein
VGVSAPTVTPEPLTISVSANQMTLTLAPLNLMPAAKAAGLEVVGSATPQSYTLRLAGTGSAAEVRSVLGALPPLGDGAEAAMPVLKDAGDKPVKVDVTCTRSWGAVQSCVAATESPKAVKRGRR